MVRLAFMQLPVTSNIFTRKPGFVVLRSVCRLANHKWSRLPLAVKVIRKDKAPQDFMERFLPRELDILEKLSHPNIIALYHTINLTNYTYIFMELAENGDLLDYVKVRDI